MYCINIALFMLFPFLDVYNIRDISFMDVIFKCGFSDLFFEKTQKTFAFHFIGKIEFVKILLRGRLQGKNRKSVDIPGLR